VSSGKTAPRDCHSLGDSRPVRPPILLSLSMLRALPFLHFEADESTASSSTTQTGNVSRVMHFCQDLFARFSQAHQMIITSRDSAIHAHSVGVRGAIQNVVSCTPKYKRGTRIESVAPHVGTMISLHPEPCSLPRHCEERSDEAIPSFCPWAGREIASSLRSSQ
jgi:hypothetical protein